VTTEPEHEEKQKKERFSRRNFLKGVIITAASIPVVSAAGCTPTEAPPHTSPTGYQSSAPPPINPDVPLAPAAPPNPMTLRTFTAHEARTVEALTARILPGTPDDPGAREAGVTTYIDNMLSYQEGFNESTYREPPYAQIYSEETAPAEDATYQTIWVAADEIERYGYQSNLSPREVYRFGVVAVDVYARSKFERRFIDLTDEEQDSILEDMVNDDAEVGFEQVAASAFFTILRRHTAEGMFSDPAYGGNREMAGWWLIGYPGAQRAYTEHDIRTETTTPRPPQSLAQLHPFSPGENAGLHVVLPVSGSQEDYPVHHEHP
jgi:gluconate 2-dehydrogenase gamma chain